MNVISLAPIDWVIICLYFVAIIGIGLYLRRFTKTGEDFFLAGRRNSSWVAGLAFLSANLGALEILGWFFVGIILAVYGVLLVIADFLPQPRNTVLAETHPALWWGIITTVGGAVFLAIGLRGRGQSAKEQNKA